MERVTISSLLDGKAVEVFPGLFVFTPPRQATYNDVTPDQPWADNDVLAISYSLPHAGIGYVIMEDSLIGRAVQAYQLQQRLGTKKQLGYLIDPADDALEPPVFTGSFQQTRYLHSLDVAVLGALMLYNNRQHFDQYPGLAEAALVALVSHDALTPAASDSTKAVDFERFDEDKHYPTLIREAAVANFIKTEGIDFNLVCAIVRNEGVAGAILDLADKLAYTARDTINFDGGRDTYAPGWSWKQPERQDVSDWTTRDKIAGVWQDVQIDERHGLVLTDPHCLLNFLNTRARMFKHVYSGAKSRYHEALYVRNLLSFLYETGELTAEWLLAQSDETLRLHVLEWFGEDFIENLHRKHDVYCRSFATLDAAQEFERRLVQRGNVFVQLDDVRRFFKPATHFLVDTQEGVMTFADSAPDLASKVTAAGKAHKPIRMYYIKDRQPQLPDRWRHPMHVWRKDKLKRTRAAPS